MEHFSIVSIFTFLTFLYTPSCYGEDSSSQEYYGLLLAAFNGYHHGVTGTVYAVNATTLFIKDFNYDGMAKDAYFWGGSGGNGPNPNGFIIPDQHGTTNVLRKYDNKDFTLNLPDGRRLSDLNWLSVYDLTKYESFASIHIPDNFEPPGVVTLPPLTVKGGSDDISDCSTDEIELLDMKTVKIHRLSLISYHTQENYFAVGKGHVPTLRSGAGWRIPDENGYLEPLRSYNAEDVTLILPGELTLSDDNVHWLAIYDKAADKPLCYINLPSTSSRDGGGKAIPPSLRKTIKYDYSLPNCMPLHRDFHVAWDVVGQTITFELVAVANEDDYLGFGLSGSPNKTQMIGSDMAIGHYNSRTGQAIVQDYNVDAKAPCTSILEKKRGVCLDSDLGHADSIQALEGRKLGPLIILKYRRQLKKADESDKDIDPDNPVPVIWALGRLMANGQPGFHRLYPRKHMTKIQFMQKQETKRNLPKDKDERSFSHHDEDSKEQDSFSDMNCQPFLIPEQNERLRPWQPAKIVDGKLRSFSARLGPSAGLRGYEGMTGVANPGYAWYIQGYLAPELYMQRGIIYSFKVEGGNNPHNVETYHPFIITTEPIGGQNALLYPRTSTILAGVETTRRGQSRPTVAGRLCLWSHDEKGRNNFKTSDRRLDETYLTFEKFRNSLKLRCENGSEPSIVEITPNTSWPDIVYYHSHTQPGMGWRIHVLDGAVSSSAVSGGESTMTQSTGVSLLTALSMSIILAFSCICCNR